MQQIEHSIAEYLDALAKIHGQAYSGRTVVRHTGGADVVIAYPNGHKTIINIGRLRLMTEHLRAQADFKQAA